MRIPSQQDVFFRDSVIRVYRVLGIDWPSIKFILRYNIDVDTRISRNSSR